MAASHSRIPQHPFASTAQTYRRYLSYILVSLSVLLPRHSYSIQSYKSYNLIHVQSHTLGGQDAEGWEKQREQELEDQPALPNCQQARSYASELGLLVHQDHSRADDLHVECLDCNLRDSGPHGHWLLRSPGNFPRVLVDLHSPLWHPLFLHCHPADACLILFSFSRNILEHGFGCLVVFNQLLVFSLTTFFTRHHFPIVRLIRCTSKLYSRIDTFFFEHVKKIMNTWKDLKVILRSCQLLLLNACQTLSFWMEKFHETPRTRIYLGRQEYCSDFFSGSTLTTTSCMVLPSQSMTSRSSWPIPLQILSTIKHWTGTGIGGPQGIDAGWGWQWMMVTEGSGWW